MAAARRQVGDFLFAGGRETFRVVIESRHPAGLGHIEPGLFFRAEGQAVGLIQPIEHGHHGIGDAVVVFIRQGHHPPLGGEADQEVAIGVQGQDPGACQLPGENVEANPGGSFKGKAAGSVDFPAPGAWPFSGSPAMSRGGGRSAGPASRKFCQIVRRGPQTRSRQEDADDNAGFFHRKIEPRLGPGERLHAPGPDNRNKLFSSGFFHHIQEFLKQVIGVMGAWGGLGVVLDRKGPESGMAQPL